MLAAWAFAPHYVWNEVLSYELAEIDGWWCLFARYVDGMFMPLPPLGPRPGVGLHIANAYRDVVNQAMDFMKGKNHGREVTRIENVPGELKSCFEDMGYTLTSKDPDYLYRRQDIIGLKGDRYKAPRAAYNRFLRAHRARVRPYEMIDRDECLALFHRWAAQKEAQHAQVGMPSDTIAGYMLQDAESAHRVILHSSEPLGLIGRVLWVDGVIRAYTFGFERSSDVFCVLVEVADRTLYGAAQFLFREFCREMEGYAFINTMDDSGLPSLARSKRAYHPIQMVANYIVTS